jgi:hypothetical protein
MPLGTFTTVDARLSRQLAKRAQLYIAVENLFNETYATARTSEGVVSIGAPRMIQGASASRSSPAMPEAGWCQSTKRSTRCSGVAGMVNPSERATFVLMTNVILRLTSTGMVPGAAPLTIFCTMRAA